MKSFIDKIKSKISPSTMDKILTGSSNILCKTQSGLEELQTKIEDSRAAHPLGNIDDEQLLMTKAMVFAARADGQIDDDERAAITQVLTERSFDVNVGDAIEYWSNTLVDPKDIAVEAKRLGIEPQIHLLSNLIASGETELSRLYLGALESALSLDEADIRQP